MRTENYKPWILGGGTTTKARRDGAWKRTGEGWQERKENQWANSGGNKPGAEVHIQNPESQSQSEEGRNDERGTKNEELGMSDPISPPNPMITVCLCLCVFERLCVYVCIYVRCVIEVRFNNKPHTHTYTLTFIQPWACVCIFWKSQMWVCMNLDVQYFRSCIKCMLM